MENNPIDTPETGDAVVEESPQTPATEEAPAEETPAQETPAEPSENSTSTEEDLDALIEEEKQRGPDPEKAHGRIKKVLETDEVEEEPEDDFVESPMSREDVERIVAERTQEVLAQANEERINEMSRNLSETDKEAELVREIHKNRVFPVGMSLQDQLVEAHAIATAKRTQAKNVELGRKLQSSGTASRNTATTHRDPQASPEPKIASDLAASMKAAGYTHNAQTKRYEKKLPNGKTLVLDRPGAQPYLVN
jgi:hypothetical protein